MKLKPTITQLTAVGLLAAATAHGELIPVTEDIASGTEVTWTADNEYLLQTMIYVQTNATLIIEPGTVIKGVTVVPEELRRRGIPELISGLWVSQGGKLIADGTREQPIIFTAEGDELTGNIPPTQTALWGGVVMMGNAVLNSAKHVVGNVSDPKFDLYEGLDNDPQTGLPYPEHRFGGNDDEDSSGVLRYVSIRHAGFSFAQDSELNVLTMGGVGSGTVLEYVEVYAGEDDGFEWWGGTVNSKYLVAGFIEDDCFDTDQGYRGTNQFWFGIKAPWMGATADSRGIESDGDLNQSVFGEQPLNQWYAYNATIIGRGKDVTATDRNVAWNTRDEDVPQVFNSVFAGWDQGLKLDADGLYHHTNATMLASIQNNIWDVNTGASSAVGEFIFTTGAFNNSLQDAMLGGISYEPDGLLDPRPQPGSPVYENVLPGAPIEVNYRGAFSGPEDNWADGWTALSQYGYLKPATTVQPGVTFEQWAASQGLPAGQNGPADDPDGDGLVNIVEFALGGNPLGDSSEQTPAGTMVDVDGELYPAVTFVRSTTAVGVEIQVTAASDILFQNALELVEEPPVNLGNGTERVTVRTAAPGGATTYFQTSVLVQ
jgi:hypothetical protein